MRRSSLFSLSLFFVVPGFTIVGCQSSDPSVSSSSNWLMCTTITDCELAEDAVACKEGYCVDASDERIEAPKDETGGASSGGAGSGGASSGGASSGGASSGGASSGGASSGGQGGEAPGAPPCDEEVLDSPGLADSPRQDRNLEQLSLLAVSEIAADESSYARTVRDVTLIRELEPAVADVDYFAVYDEGLNINFDSTEDLVRIEQGDYHDWDCVNEELGATVEVLRFESLDIAYVNVTFDKVVDLTQAAEIYGEFPGVSQADPTPTLGDGPSICLLPGDDGWHYVFDDASGDCPSGCIDHVYYYFAVNEAGDIEVGETWTGSVGDTNTERPEWAALFEDAGLLSNNRFCSP